jgi:hypothetical protein
MEQRKDSYFEPPVKLEITLVMGLNKLENKPGSRSTRLSWGAREVTLTTRSSTGRAKVHWMNISIAKREGMSFIVVLGLWLEVLRRPAP